LRLEGRVDALANGFTKKAIGREQWGARQFFLGVPA
jgi:hypothetical protein